MTTIAIAGGGAFGTALACVMRRAGHAVRIWAREPEVVAAMNDQRLNPVFLPGVTLVEGIRATMDMREALAGADVLLTVAPAQHLRSVALALQPHVREGLPVISCSKGIERGSHALMPEVLAATLPQAEVGVLSGPSFAREIALDLPCGVDLAFDSLARARELAALLSNPQFCVAPCGDLPGVAIGGVMKNVISIASGVAAGRKLGENARATLITLGLAESVRLIVAKGGQSSTALRASGIGDLMLTANSVQSRNTSLGVALGEGRSLAEVLAGRREVTEGAFSAEAVAALGRSLNVHMPVSFAVDRVLNHGASVDEGIAQLMQALRRA